MREEYAEEIEATRQTGLTAVSDLRGSVIHSIIHDIRHESVKIFARNSDSRFPTDAEFQEMGKLVEMRLPEFRSVVNLLDWF